MVIHISLKVADNHKQTQDVTIRKIWRQPVESDAVGQGDVARTWAVVRTPDDLGRFLARRRVAAGWTQQELADYLDIPPRYLHEIESGKHTLAYTRLFKLLRTLDIEARLEVIDDGSDGADEGSESDDDSNRRRSDLDRDDLVADEPQAARGRVQVAPRADGRWNVIREGATRASSVHDTKAQAERRGRVLARATESELVIRGRDGRIQQRDTSSSRPDTFGFNEASRRSTADFFADFDDPAGSGAT